MHACTGLPHSQSGRDYCSLDTHNQIHKTRTYTCVKKNDVIYSEQYYTTCKSLVTQEKTKFLIQTGYLIKLKSPTEEGLVDESLLTVLTLACMHSLLSKKGILYEALYFSDKVFHHKNKRRGSVNCQKEYIYKVS